GMPSNWTRSIFMRRLSRFAPPIDRRPLHRQRFPLRFPHVDRPWAADPISNRLTLHNVAHLQVVEGLVCYIATVKEHLLSVIGSDEPVALAADHLKNPTRNRLAGWPDARPLGPSAWWTPRCSRIERSPAHTCL